MAGIAMSLTQTTFIAMAWWMIRLYYFAILFGVASRVVWQQEDTATDDFLAGRNFGW
jgi:hypothetical protein